MLEAAVKPKPAPMMIVQQKHVRLQSYFRLWKARLKVELLCLSCQVFITSMFHVFVTFRAGLFKA